MINEKNTKIEADYYAFLSKVLANPNLAKEDSGELQAVLNKLMLLNDIDQLKEIRRQTFSMLKLDPPPFTNSFNAVQEIKRSVIALSQNNQAARMNAAGSVRQMADGIYVNKVKTSDRQQKAVLDFVKG